jgi:hypothetical protein
MKKILFLFLLMLGLSEIAAGNGGYAAGDDYVFRNGYYYAGDKPYARYKEWWQEYVRYPYYHYEWKWRWAYEPVVIETKTIQLPPVTDKNWRNVAIEALTAREENELYLKVYQLLNRVEAQPSYASNISVSGDTAYARSYKADLYGSVAELAMFYGQQQARLSQDAQAYGDKANARFTQLNAHQIEIVKLLAKGEAGAKLLEALKDTPRAQFQSYETYPGGGAAYPGAAPARAKVQTGPIGGGVGTVDPRPVNVSLAMETKNQKETSI